MKAQVIMLLSGSILVGCYTDEKSIADQGPAAYDTNLTRSKIVAALPAGWSLVPHQDETQSRFTSRYFTDPQTDAFMLVGPQPNCIHWTDKQKVPHREYLAKECPYIWVMPATFEPKFQRGFLVGPPPPRVFKSQVMRAYVRVSHYTADTNRTALILKQATEISSPDLHLSWVHWRRDLAAGLKR